MLKGSLMRFDTLFAFSHSRLQAYACRLLLLIIATLAGGNAFAGQIALAWDASAGATGYKVYYGQTSGSYSANLDARNSTTYTVPSLTNGATYYFAVTAYSASGTQSAFSNQISATVPSSSAPLASFNTSATSGVAPMTVTFTDTSTGTVSSRSWSLGDGSTATSASVTKNYTTAGTYVVKLTVTGAGVSATASKTLTVTSPTSAPVADFTASPTSGTAPVTVTFVNASSTNASAWSWQFGDGGTSTAKNPSHTYNAAGSYTVSLTATGTGGSGQKQRAGYITVTAPAGGGGGGTTLNIPGLVAAYAFDETSGGSAADSSGQANHGTINGASRVGSGRTGYGNALNFNGSNTWVAVGDSASLDLTTRMTLEAWVYPTTWMSNWRTILVKEDGATNTAYYLYANTDTNQPLTGARIGNYPAVSGITQLPAYQWSHVAGTYDGQYLRMYVNGVLTSQQGQTGTIPVSSGALKIGGNAIWGEYYAGYLDDIRIYNRALSQAEVSTDFKTPIGSAGGGGGSSNIASSNIAIRWSAAADRSSSAALQGASIKGSVYIFTTPDTNVSKVDFWLDNAAPNNPTGMPLKTELLGPFDLAGTTGVGTANPYNTVSLTTGSHTFTARATMADGTVKAAVSSSFTVTR
jgi:PKD repeat protein